MTTEYDAIIIGAGPNGLTCAAYLARAGAKTLVLERKHEAGGGLSSEDFGCPFRFNLHATYMMLAELMPPHTDLGLEKYDLAYIRPEPQVAFLYKDGKALVFYTDPQKSAESVRRISPKDGQAFEKLYTEFKQMCDEILIPATYAPPVPVLDQIELLNRTELGRRVVEISEMTPKQIVDSYGFQDPRVKAAILHLATMWGIHPETSGVGYMVPIYVYRMMNAALVRGGSHTLASALYAAMVSNGGKYFDSAEAEKLIMEDGVAKGVQVKDGREFRARAVVSTLDPEQTFLRLVGRERLPKELGEATEKWEWEEWSLFTAHLGIKGDPPTYRAAEFNPDVNSALLNIIGYESPKDIDQHLKDLEAGKLLEPAGGVTCTTLHDPLQAAPGPFGPLHTLRWEGWAPYALAGKARWDDVKQDYGNRCFAKWREYAPNLGSAKVLFNFVYSPLDIERRIVNMKKGSIKHGAYTSLQMGYFRPNDQCSTYRTPVRGLYLGGASVYPGGMVILAPGYNAAKVVADDLGARVWWTPPDYVIKAREKGYLP